MTDFRIHRQLLEDCHTAGIAGVCTVLLHKNSMVPWFILVPDTRATDIFELDVDTRCRVMSECHSIAGYIKNTMGYQKLNFAGIGNIVPQLHLHVIGRREGDACWPSPVWGNLQAFKSYDDEGLALIQRDLSALFGHGEPER